MFILEIIGILGFTLLGFLIPEFIMTLDPHAREAPIGQNIVSAISAACISTYFIY